MRASQSVSHGCCDDQVSDDCLTTTSLVPPRDVSTQIPGRQSSPTRVRPLWHASTSDSEKLKSHSETSFVDSSPTRGFIEMQQADGLVRRSSLLCPAELTPPQLSLTWQSLEAGSAEENLNLILFAGARV